MEEKAYAAPRATQNRRTTTRQNRKRMCRRVVGDLRQCSVIEIGNDPWFGESHILACCASSASKEDSLPPPPSPLGATARGIHGPTTGNLEGGDGKTSRERASTCRGAGELTLLATRDSWQCSGLLDRNGQEAGAAGPLHTVPFKF